MSNNIAPPCFCSGSTSLRPFERQQFMEHVPGWHNNASVTAMMFAGTFPVTADSAGKIYDDLVNPANANALFAISDSDEGNPIGYCGLFDIEWITGKAEFRILIGDTGAWKKGHGKRATRLITEYGFRQLNLQRVWLGVNKSNIVALSCYESAGYVREGTLRREIYCEGTYLDVVRMSVLRDEFVTE
jgi:RimJ/RimL family protein N-acetyltransferase